MIHHSPHPERILEQMRHYIGRESQLRVMVYHRDSWKVLWILLTYGKGRFWRLGELVARYSEAQEGCPITFMYSRAQGRELIERAGFRVAKVWVDYIFPYRILTTSNTSREGSGISVPSTRSISLARGALRVGTSTITADSTSTRDAVANHRMVRQSRRRCARACSAWADQARCVQAGPPIGTVELAGVAPPVD